MTLKSSLAPVADARTRVLILGSLPGDRSLAEQRYYAHPQNQFWRLVGAAIDRDLTALDYEDRLAALLDARIGLWDVVASARRTGSSDATIREHTANDLGALIGSLPDLGAVGFNGGKALAIGRPLIASHPLAIIFLPSSSPLHTIGFDAKRPAWMTLRHHLS